MDSQNSNPPSWLKLMLQRHPVASAIIAIVLFLCWTLPLAIASAWPAFVRDKTIPEWLAERRWPGMTAQLYGWLTILFFLALATLLVVIIVMSRRKQVSTQSDASTQEAPIDEEQAKLIEKLEREKTELKNARDAAIRERENAEEEAGRQAHLAETHSIRATMNHNLLEQLKTQYGWLHDEARRDENDISKYVYIIFNKVKYEGLDEIEPYFEVVFNIINASVYNIIIDKDIHDGAVYFNDLRLKSKQAELGGSLHSISRGERERRFLVIRQGVSPELAKRIKNPLPDDKLSFSTLWLNVRAANNSEIEPHRLSLPSEIPVQMPEKLKTDIASLKSELEELRKYELTLEISTDFDSSILLILNKETQPFPHNEYIIKAYLKIRFRNPDKYKTTIEGMALSLCTRSGSGEFEVIQSDRFDLDVYPDSPIGAQSSGLYRIDFDKGLPVDGGALTEYYWFWYHLEISRKKVSSIGSNHILQLTMKAMRQSRPHVVNIQVDWENARSRSTYILPPHIGSTCVLPPE